MIIAIIIIKKTSHTRKLKTKGKNAKTTDKN